MLNRQHHFYNVLISGAGPAGLCAAYYALQAGHTVCLVSKHVIGSFVRDQKVFLDLENKKRLQAMYYFFERNKDEEDLNDVSFMKKLDRDHFIPIYDVEMYLYRRVIELSKALSFPLVVYDGATLEMVNLARGEAVIKRQHTLQNDSNEEKKDDLLINFTYLIGADGTRHHATDVVNENLPKSQRITYHAYYPNPHLYHMNVFITSITQGPGNEPFNYKKQQFLGQQGGSARISKKGFYRGILFDTNESGVTECNINCEIPKKLYQQYYATKADYQNALPNPNTVIVENLTKAEKSIEDFLSELLIEETNTPLTINLKKDNLGRIKVNLFRTEQREASSTYVLIKDATSFHVFVVIGDAFQTPYYPLGNGMRKALDHAERLQRVFHCTKDDIKEVLKHFDQLAKATASSSNKKILVGTFLKKTVWNSSDVGLRMFINKEKDSYPQLHTDVINRNIAKIFELVQAQPNTLYMVDKNKNNILHVIEDWQTYVELTNKIPAVKKLLNQYNAQSEPALLHLMKVFPDKITQIFTNSDELINYRDYEGNTVAHTIMHLVQFRDVLPLLDWLYQHIPQILLTENCMGETPMDKLRAIVKDRSSIYGEKALEYISALSNDAIPSIQTHMKDL